MLLMIVIKTISQVDEHEEPEVDMLTLDSHCVLSALQKALSSLDVTTTSNQ